MPFEMNRGDSGSLPVPLQPEESQDDTEDCFWGWGASFRVGSSCTALTGLADHVSQQVAGFLGRAGIPAASGHLGGRSHRCWVSSTRAPAGHWSRTRPQPAPSRSQEVRSCFRAAIQRGPFSPFTSPSPAKAGLGVQGGVLCHGKGTTSHPPRVRLHARWGWLQLPRHGASHVLVLISTCEGPARRGGWVPLPTCNMQIKLIYSYFMQLGFIDSPPSQGSPWFGPLPISPSSVSHCSSHRGPLGPDTGLRCTTSLLQGSWTLTRCKQSPSPPCPSTWGNSLTAGCGHGEHGEQKRLVSQRGGGRPLRGRPKASVVRTGCASGELLLARKQRGP